MLWTDKVKKILKKYWNYDNLKEKQINVINELLQGNDVIGLLPTGYGKSMCYILPPLLTKKTIFIISPLISLMDDQKEKLISRGIPVSALHCNNTNKQQEIYDIIDSKIKIVYMSPEFIIDGDGLELAKVLIEKNQLGYLAIDESHCLSAWGHDFRPQYLKLKKFRETFENIPILAVTATAKEVVVKEIINILKLRNPQIIRANFDRPNLYIECREIPKILVKKKEKQMAYDEIIKEYIEKYKDERIIIYINNRKKTEEITDKLNEFYGNKVVNTYHAGLTKRNREKVQNDFINNKCRIIISTIAFGMGIDQVVKCVLVFGCPSSIEEYYQEIGRGGRDGELCETILYFDKSCFVIKKKMIELETKNPILKKNKIDNLSKMYEYFETKKCRRQFILEYLGLSKSYFAYNGFTCTNCDNCTKYNLIDITNYIWDYLFDKKINKKIENVIFDRDFRINKILNDWKAYIQFKGYTLDNLPENIKIKLRLNNEDFDENEIIFDKYEKLLN